MILLEGHGTSLYLSSHSAFLVSVGKCIAFIIGRMAILRCLMRVAVLSCVPSIFATALASAEVRGPFNPTDSHSKYDDLLHHLSPKASIEYDIVPRWSAFNAPTPGATVNVATEKDVQTTVRMPSRIEVALPDSGSRFRSSTASIRKSPS